MNRSPPNDSLIEGTRRLWDSRFGRDLSCEDARQVAENVAGFFAVLAEWSNAERRAAKDNEAPSKPDDRRVRHDRWGRSK
jgi:hypothetical protein